MNTDFVCDVAELVQAVKDLRVLYESTPADDNSRQFWAASESAWARVDAALANVGAQS